jgi:hypothetical protein
MVRRLGLEDELLRENISRFERGVGGEPPLGVLLRYARSISTTGRGEFLEALIDDEMDLPEILPASPRTHRPKTVTSRTSLGQRRNAR